MIYSYGYLIMWVKSFNAKYSMNYLKPDLSFYWFVENESNLLYKDKKSIL